MAADGWEWPYARLVDIHDGDTVRLDVDQGFSVHSYQWIRLLDVWAPELNEEGGPEARELVRDWFDTYAPGGTVQLITYRQGVALEIRFKQTFTRYVGVIKTNSSTLNEWLQARL